MAYVSYDFDRNSVYDSIVAVAGVNGGAPRVVWGPEGDNSPLTGAFPSVPVWNPSGTELAVEEPWPFGTDPENGCDIWIIPVSGKGAHRILHNDSCGVVGLSWSPDGKQLAFPGLAGPEVVKVTGGKPRLLAKVTPSPPGPTPGTHSTTGSVESVSWSPDGSTILAATLGTTTIADPYKQADSVIEAFPVAGGPPKILVDDPPGPINIRLSAIYSPDGSKIAFTQAGGPATDQYEQMVIANADGSDPVVLGRLQVHDARAYITSWS
jgi:Tol biopolymer transport system component